MTRPFTTAPADTASAMHAAEMRGQDMQDAELVAQLRGRHRFCIDRGEIKTPELLCESADRIEALAAELAECQRRIDAAVQAEREVLRWAHDTLWEINPSNYSHDDVCLLNDASVEVILGIAPLIGETHGKSAEWWADRAAAIRARGQK